MSGEPTGPASPGRQRWWRPTATGWLAIAVTLLLCARLAVHIRRYASNLLYWDQWDTLTGFFRGAGLFELFRWQHGPHRQGLGALLYAVLLPASDWDTRVEALVAGGLFALAAGLALAACHRFGGRLGAWDVAVPLIFLSTVPSSTFFGVQNLAHGPASTLLVVALAVAWLDPCAWRRALLVVVLDGLAVNTGFGLVVGPLVPVLLMIDALRSPRRDRGWLLAGAALTALELALFFVGWKPLAARGSGVLIAFAYPPLMLGRALAFFGDQFATARSLLALQWTASVLALGALLWIAIAALADALRGDETRRRQGLVITLLIGFSAAFWFATGLGRGAYELRGALPSRYVPYAYPALLGAFWWLRRLPRARGRRAALVAVLLLLVGRELIDHSNERHRRWIHAAKQRWSECYLATRSVAACDNPAGFHLYPNAQRVDLEARLAWLEENRLSFFADQPEKPRRRRRPPAARQQPPPP